MSTTTIREILGNRALHHVSPELTLRDAAKEMATHKIGAVAVVDEGRLCGILSERDIVFRCVGQGHSVDQMTVAEVMTGDPKTIDIDEPISDALATKLGNPFRHLPVMEHGNPVGILSYRDIPAEYVVMFERFREMQSAHADDGP